MDAVGLRAHGIRHEVSPVLVSEAVVVNGPVREGVSLLRVAPLPDCLNHVHTHTNIVSYFVVGIRTSMRLFVSQSFWRSHPGVNLDCPLIVEIVGDKKTCRPELPGAIQNPICLGPMRRERRTRR